MAGRKAGTPKTGGRKVGDNTPKKHRPGARSRANLKPAWAPGQSGNPAGRPKGSRNKLSEQYLSSVCAIYDECGDEAVREAMRRDPEVLIRVVTSLLPKKIEVEGSIKPIYVMSGKHLSPDEWAAKYADTPGNSDGNGNGSDSPDGGKSVAQPAKPRARVGAARRPAKRTR